MSYFAFLKEITAPAALTIKTFLKILGIVENSSDSADNENAAKSRDSLHSENNKDVLFKFLEDELKVIS